MRLLAALLALALASPAAAQNVLRVVPQADLRVLDPTATAATVTRMRDRHHASGNCGCRAATRASARVIGVPRIARNSPRFGLG